jgi:hypothetical protein
MFTCHEHIMRIFEQAQTEVRLLPSRHARVAEPVVVQPPPPEPEKPKRKKAKPEPVVELPPPPPPVIVPEEEPQRFHWPDPNELFAEAEQEEQWFYPTNEHEMQCVEEAPAPVVVRKLPDYWPVVPIPVPEELTLAPEPTKIARIDPPAPPKLIRRRLPRFTWGSPEVYWDEEAAEVAETVTAGRKSSKPVASTPPLDNPWSGWDL